MIDKVLQEMLSAGVITAVRKVGRVYHITAAPGWVLHVRLWAQARGVAAIVN